MSTTAEKGMPMGCFPRLNRFGSKKERVSVEEKPRKLSLDDKVAVITGAATGVGAVTARLFVFQGARVIIADIEAEAGRKLSSELGSSAHFFRCDITKEADVAAAVDYAVKCWGRLDIMFNNAGVPGPLAGLADINIEEFDQVMAVHIKGAVLGQKHAARVMIPARKGVILFSGSMSAQIGGSGPPLHLAANAAVLCIARSAAAELAQHVIRCNAISPHYVNPKKDVAVEQLEQDLAAPSQLEQALTSENVASAVMFLARDDAGFLNGHNLVLDGGFTITKPFDSSELKATQGKGGAQSSVKPPISSLEGSGYSKLPTASVARKREMADTPRVEEAKGSSDRTSEREGDEKERTKVGTGRKVQEKTAEDPKTQDSQTQEKKASAEEERIQSQNVELPKAGPEPDIPLDNQSRPPVKTFGSLFSLRRKNSKKVGENDNKSTDPENVTKRGKEDGKSIDSGEGKEDKSYDPGKVQGKTAPAKEAKDPKTQDPKTQDIHPREKKASAEEERIQSQNDDLPKAGPEPADIPLDNQSRPPVKTFGSLFSLGRKNSKKVGEPDNKSTDPENVTKQGKEDAKSIDSGEGKGERSNDPGKVSKKNEKEGKDIDPETVSKREAKSRDNEEISPESQPKQSSGNRNGSLGKDSSKADKKESKGKVSTEKTQKGESSKKEANSPAKEEKLGPQREDSRKTPTSPAITPGPQPKQPAFYRINGLLGLGNKSKKKTKVVRWGTDNDAIQEKPT